MKKWLLSVASTALVFSVAAAGCSSDGGKGEAGATSSPASGASPAATAPPKLDPVKLKMYYAGAHPQKDNQAVQDEINKILKQKINAEVELVGIDWSAYLQKMPLNFQSGEQVDLVFTARGLGAMGYYENVAKNAFLPMNDLLDKYGQDIKKNLNPALLEGPKINGKLYAIPTNKEIAENNAVFFVKSIADKHGVTEQLQKVKILEDLEPILKTIKEKEPALAPVWIGRENLFNEFALNKVSEAPENKGRFEKITGAPTLLNMDLKEGKVVVGPTLPHIMEKYKIARKWYEAGYINKDAATNKTNADDAIKSGKSWMSYGSGKPDSENEKKAAMGIEFIKINTSEPKISTESVTGSMLAIGSTSKNPERAMMLLNLLHSDKQLLNLLVWGIEGKHYVKASDNVIKLPEGVKNRKDAGYDPGVQWMIGNQFLNYLWDNENPKKWDMYNQYNNTAKKSELIGFSFDPTPVKTEVAALQNVEKEFSPILNTGGGDPDEVVKKYIDKLNANGLEKVKAEVQKQYDEWKKNK